MVAKLYLGDCLEILPTLPGQSVDLIFTSPPYYNAKKYSRFPNYSEYLSFMENAIRCACKVLSADGYFILNTSPVIAPRKSRNEESQRFPIPFDTYAMATKLGFKYVDDIVWEKPDGASSRAVKFSHHRRPTAYKPFTVTEYLFVFRKANAPLIDKGIRKHTKDVIQKSLVLGEYERTNVWKISPARSKLHPAPFPLELAEKVISYYSFVGDMVLDPFAGIGTTGLACGKLDRNFIGIEKDPKYFEIAKQRLETISAESTIKA